MFESCINYYLFQFLSRMYHVSSIWQEYFTFTIKQLTLTWKAESIGIKNVCWPGASNKSSLFLERTCEVNSLKKNGLESSQFSSHFHSIQTSAHAIVDSPIRNLSLSRSNFPAVKPTRVCESPSRGVKGSKTRSMMCKYWTLLVVSDLAFRFRMISSAPFT